MNPTTIQPKPQQKRQAPAPTPAVKGIRLKPSATDYGTFVRRTSEVLGDTGPASRKTKPNKRLLALARMAS